MSKNKKKDLSKAPNYLHIRDVGRGGMGAVYEAIPLDDPSQKVAIKIISQPGGLSHDMMHRFQKEATLMSQLYHPNIITFHEFGLIDDTSNDSESKDHGYYIVMDLATGKNLKEILSAEGSKGMSLSFFFQLGQQVASALDYTHGKDIIHRDIKPQNIVIEKPDDDNSEIIAKVLDFGVASLGEARNYTGVDRKGFDDFAGTPLYLAPELTKLIDAQPDHRVDLYSLGCVLYEALAGRTPFSGTTREELKRKHATEPPLRLEKIRSDIPTFVCDMVHKLLEKHPDDRYHTAFSFYSDLIRAEKLLKSLKTGEGVELASSLLPKLALNDRFRSVGARLQLVGRNEEFEKLTKFYDAVANESARGRISIVSSSPGVGKSRLIQELRSYFIERKVRFVSGSFTKHESSIPFNALASAFDEYLIKISRSQPLEAQNMKTRFKSMLGVHAYSVAEVIPAMSAFLEDIPRPEIEDDDFGDYSSFVKAFTDFTRCLMSTDQPIVFLFDDLHYADEKSLHLIDQFFTYNNSQRIYLIVTCQDSMFYKNPQFDDFVAKVSRLRRRYQKLELAPLNRNNVEELFYHMLDVNDQIFDDSIIDYFSEITAGNPVHLFEKTRDLVLNGEIRQDPEVEKWSFDLEDIKRVSRPLQNVDLALSRIASYSIDELHILEVAATAGLSFQQELLKLVKFVDRSLLEKTLKRALKEGLIERHVEDKDMDFLGLAYRFTHRSMRESIYGGIDENKLRDIHLAIADKIVSLAKSYNTQTIFTLAHHLNKGVMGDLSASKSRLSSSLKFNLEAAYFAKEQGSLPSSIKFYKNALTIVERHLWDVIELSEKVSIYEKLASVQMKYGDFKESIENLKKILEISLEVPFSKFPRDIYANVMKQYISIHLREGKISQAFEICKEAIAAFDRKQASFSSAGIIAHYLFLVLDIISIRYGFFKSPILKIMGLLKSNKREKTTSLSFYNLAFEAARYIDKDLAFVVHQKAYLVALKGKSSRKELFDFFLHRSVIVSQYNLETTCRRLFRFAEKIGKKIGVKSYAKSLATSLMYNSHRNNKTHKRLEMFQLQDVFKAFSSPEYSVLNAQMRGFSAFHLLMRGEIQSSLNEVHRALGSVSTRSIETPYLIMVVLFIKLMRGESNSLVLSAESYLEKRKHRNARKNDPFVFLISSTVSLINGKFEQMKDMYFAAHNALCHNDQRKMYSPHQIEFGIFCLAVLPSFYEYSTGKKIAEAKEFGAVLGGMSRSLKSFFIKDPLLAHLLDGLRSSLGGNREGLKKVLSVVTISKTTKLDLLYLFSSYIAGKVTREKFSRKLGRDELLGALTTSRRIRLIGVIRMVETRLESYGFEYPRRDNRGGLVKVDSKFTSFPTTLAIDYLQQILPQMGQKHINSLLSESMRLFKLHYGGSNLHFILFKNKAQRSDPRVVYSHAGAVKDEKLIEFIHPYFDIQMSLFLPCVSREWIDDETEQNVTPVFDEEEYTKIVAVDKSLQDHSDSQNDQTFVAEEDEATVVGNLIDKTKVDQKPTFDPINTQAKSSNSGMTMCCLIPLHDGKDVMGMIFVENIGELYQSNSLESRKEIDLWAAQVGFFLANNHIYTREVPMPHENTVSLRYAQGSYQLEKCKWLNVWQYGRLRKDRESSWYLGLNFNEDVYVTVYCQLIGEEDYRERLSHKIWHHLVTLRSNIQNGADETIKLDSIYEDCAFLLQSTEEATKLEEISLSLSVVRRDERSVESGHFGASRPLVLGGENRVKPENEAILRYQRGGALYYWRVSASLADYMPLILTRNVTQLEKAFHQEDYLQVSDLYRYEVPFNASNTELHEALERVVGLDLVPRYYVGLVLKRSAQEWESGQDAYDGVG